MAFDKELVPNIDIDWTTKGAVSRVKFKWFYSSAYAFATTGACESQALIHSRHIELSEQQLIDCSAAYGKTGYTGGLIEYAMKYIKDHGITTE
jgi:cathepsin L